MVPMQPPSTFGQITKKRLVSIGLPGPTMVSHQPGLPVTGCSPNTYWSPESAWQTRIAFDLFGVERAVGHVGDLERRERDARVELQGLVRAEADDRRTRLVHLAAHGAGAACSSFKIGAHHAHQTLESARGQPAGGLELWAGSLICQCFLCVRGCRALHHAAGKHRPCRCRSLNLRRLTPRPLRRLRICAPRSTASTRNCTRA